MSKIRIHFAGLRPGQRPVDLACALGIGGFEPEHGAPGPEYGKYDELNNLASQLFESVGLDDAQVVIYAHGAHNDPEILHVSAAAQKRELPCFFLAWGDEDEPVSVPYGTVYRHCMFDNTRNPCEEAWPAFCSDPLTELGQAFTPRPWQSKPTVGFCGFVGTPIKRILYTFLGRRKKAHGLSLRKKAIAALSGNNRISTRFVRRNDYWGGMFRQEHFGTVRQREVRRDFLDNLLGTDYTLCIRGKGNFSYRLYETLAAGRIPLFINTRCVLPFDRQIDWRRHCVWVEEDNLRRAGDVLADFHSGLSPDEFTRMQESNRQLWRQWLCPVGFYTRILSAVGIPNPPAHAVVQ